MEHPKPNIDISPTRERTIEEWQNFIFDRLRHPGELDQEQLVVSVLGRIRGTKNSLTNKKFAQLMNLLDIENLEVKEKLEKIAGKWAFVLGMALGRFRADEMQEQPE